MSFAEFEREVIGERIRDKVRATRRRGMWTGGRPWLGYDVVDKKAGRNRRRGDPGVSTFQLYLERGSLRETVAELKRRGWHNKSFSRPRSRSTDRRPFSKATLYALLTTRSTPPDALRRPSWSRSPEPIVDAVCSTPSCSACAAMAAAAAAEARNRPAPSARLGPLRSMRLPHADTLLDPQRQAVSLLRVQQAAQRRVGKLPRFRVPPEVRLFVANQIRVMHRRGAARQGSPRRRPRSSRTAEQLGGELAAPSKTADALMHSGRTCSAPAPPSAEAARHCSLSQAAIDEQLRALARRQE